MIAGFRGCGRRYPFGVGAKNDLAGAKQAAEKGLISGERPEKHTSGAKAHIDSIGLIPGINPRPTARMSFSAACKARLFCDLYGTTKAVPFQNINDHLRGGTARSWP